MKKGFFALCLLLGLVFTCAAASAYDGSMVKVGLKYGGSAPEAAEFSSDYGLNFYNAVTGDLFYTSSAGESVTVARIEGGYISEGKFTAAGVEKLSVQSVNKTPIRLDGAAYRGYFFLDGCGEKFNVINFVHMNNYLYGVLGKEMSSYFPKEALKAQAVCAKNYVIGESVRHASQGFDVCATTHCQVYGGVGAESEPVREAVDEIGDKAAYYNGEIVPLYFFATSGGRTESAENVWGGAAAYLLSVDDPFEPADKAGHYTWETTLTAEEITERLMAKGINIGLVTGITVDETAPSGRVLKLTFHGTEGSKTVEREGCRSTIGVDRLYSQRFTVSSNASPMESEFPADGSSEVYTSPLTFTFSGRGYGHGVGMSQWGAYGMANQGYGYEDILKHYFTGIEIK